MTDTLKAGELAQVEELLATFDQEVSKVSLFLGQVLSALSEDAELQRHVHSFKSRLKERDRLKGKLLRKVARAREEAKSFDITPENLLTRINDLAGVRILHLYTRQVRDIDQALRSVLSEQQYALREEPFARTWDVEYRDFFESIGIRTQESPTLYTSVHYVVGSASRTTTTCEIQVRTLMEEVWGEVDHSINYPTPVDSLSCSEQLKVLARVTSSATRLVDSIFLSYEDIQPKPVDTESKKSVVKKSVVKKSVVKKSVTKKPLAKKSVKKKSTGSTTEHKKRSS
jgi:putative GTP pyrophosphokinase